MIVSTAGFGGAGAVDGVTVTIGAVDGVGFSAVVDGLASEDGLVSGEFVAKRWVATQLVVTTTKAAKITRDFKRRSIVPNAFPHEVYVQPAPRTWVKREI